MSPLPARVRDALRQLERQGSLKIRQEQRIRYGITAVQAFGVPMGAIQKLADDLGKDHVLAQQLWASGWYEARLLAAYVDLPEEVTPTQMDAWAREWDNWGVVDTHCFVLFDRTPHAWGKVKQWSRRKEEYVRRGAFALLASLALHDRTGPDSPYLAAIPLIEAAANDGRNFVWKGVAWAVRAIGMRSTELNRACRELAGQWVASDDGVVQRLGRSALRDLKRPVRRRAPAGTPSRRSPRRQS